MKKIIFPLLAIAIAAGIWAFSEKKEDSGSGTTLNIGDKAPMTEVSMLGTDGVKKSLQDLAGDKGTLLIFSCNTCPFVIEWEKEYPALAKKAKDLGMSMVLLNSNEAKRGDDDSLEEMKKHAEEKGYAHIAYLVDQDNKLADAYGAKTTPHVYLFDKEMKLAYKGLIDDRFDNREKKVNNTYLANAMDRLASGKKPDPASTPEKGCSIKRKKA